MISSETNEPWRIAALTPTTEQDTATINVPTDHFFTTARRSIRIGLVLVSALIVYGSLFPFRFAVPHDPIAALIALFGNWQLTGSRGDALGNVALFLPFGLLAAGLAHYTRRHVLTRFALFAAGTALAIACQIAQIGLPTRTAAMGDVIWNMAGLVLGMATARYARFMFTPEVQLCPLVYPAAIGGLWIAAELAPWVPTLSRSTIADNLLPLLATNPALSDALLSAAGLFVTTALLVPALPRRIRPWIAPGLIAIVLLGKVIVVGQGLGTGTCTGLLIGLWLHLFVRVHSPQESATVAALVLTGAITLRALAPFEFSYDPGPWHWIPFQSWLQGSLMTNLRSAAENLFLYAGLLSIVAANRRHALGPAIALACWVAALEVAQVWIAGRSGDITEPLFVLAIGAILKSLVPVLPRPVYWEAAESAPQRAYHPLPLWRPYLEILLVCIGIGIAFGIVLELPRIPYNIRELFLDDGSFLARAAFGLPLLWIGIGSALAAEFVLRSRVPLLAWGAAILGCSVVSLLLLSTSVTQESIGDISGSNNLYWFVTNKDIWGPWWRDVFLAVGSPGLVSFLERPVRYAALYGPLCTALALAWIFNGHLVPRRLTWKRFGLVLGCALPWLWLCKAIAFDWSSTDNLNELIARDGPWGFGGGGYLYLLLMLVATNGAFLSPTTDGNRQYAAATATLVAVPIGWWLIGAGLASEIQKYHQTFSGLDFLLGPDRIDRMSTILLLARWATVQIGLTLFLALGLTLARHLQSAIRRLSHSGRTAARRTKATMR